MVGRRRDTLGERVTFKSNDGLTLSGVYRKVSVKSKAGIVLAHGICSSKDYVGFHASLADELAGFGFDTLRFDFRGHGESEGMTENITVAGEVGDLAAAVRFLRTRCSSPTGIVGHSFGGAIAVLYAAEAIQSPFALVLLAPVLDFRRTLLEPETPWARQWFTPSAMAEASRNGVLDVGGIRIGAELIRNFHTADPTSALQELLIPVLVIHGDGDTVVPFQATREASKAHAHVKFVRIAGAEHYFEDKESRVFRTAAEWLESKVPS